MFGHNYPHRLLCSCLQEMREILEKQSMWNYKRNTDIMNSLVEEIQVYANRMEAGLEYGNDLVKLHERRKELRKKVDELEKRVPKEDRDDS